MPEKSATPFPVGITFRQLPISRTEQLGREIAKRITGPISIALNGTLGAGKTLLARSLISALGVEPNSISSPTFTICQEHRGNQFPIYHVDLYRVADEDELMELGVEQWLESDGVSIIEWADRFPWVNDSCDLKCDLEILDQAHRDIFASMPRACENLADFGSLKPG